MNKYLFRYGFEKGKKIRNRITTFGSFRISGPAGVQATPIRVDMIMSQLIEDCDENKGIVKVVIEEAIGDKSIPKESMPEVGKAYEMEMDSLGNCNWLEGKAGWQGAEHSMMLFPVEEIEIGDTWVQKVEETSGSALPFYNRFRLNGRDRRNTDLIVFSSEIYTGHPDIRTNKCLGKGNFTFNLEEKWIQDSSVSIKYEYSIPMPQNPSIALNVLTNLNVEMERL